MTTDIRVYEATGQTLEEATQRAHDKIPLRDGNDFTISEVIGWGMQRGGFVDARLYWVKVIEDVHAPFKT